MSIIPQTAAPPTVQSQRDRRGATGDPTTCAIATRNCEGGIGLYETCGDRRGWLCEWHGAVYTQVAAAVERKRAAS